MAAARPMRTSARAHNYAVLNSKGRVVSSSKNSEIEEEQLLDSPQWSAPNSDTDTVVSDTDLLDYEDDITDVTELRDHVDSNQEDKDLG